MFKYAEWCGLSAYCIFFLFYASSRALETDDSTSDGTADKLHSARRSRGKMLSIVIRTDVWCQSTEVAGTEINNNNDNERISKVLCHMNHAQLR